VQVVGPDQPGAPPVGAQHVVVGEQMGVAEPLGVLRISADRPGVGPISVCGKTTPILTAPSYPFRLPLTRPSFLIEVPLLHFYVKQRHFVGGGGRGPARAGRAGR